MGKMKIESFEAPKVVIAIPLAGPMIYWRTVAGILEMDKPRESDLMVFQGALVDRARNILIEKMLEHSMRPTHLFFLDADVVPPRDALSRLLADRVPIVSGVYRRRLPPHEPMAFVKHKPISFKGPRLQTVDMVGGGCLLIHRSVFEKIKGPWFTSEWTPKGHLSEDFSFCEKARKAGFKIHADTSVRPLHVETMGVGTGLDGKVKFVPLD